VRIIAGSRKGARIFAPKGRDTRPTADRVREAAFNLIGPVEGATVLDLFAGSGAMGLEALSRGAEVADFVEVSPKSLAALRANADSLGAGSAAVIHRADAMRFVEKLEAHSYDVAFADPPYDQGLATRLAELWLQTPFADIFDVEHRVNERLPGDGERRKYGGTVITLFRVSS